VLLLSIVMARTMFILTRWWRCLFGTKSTRWAGFVL